MALRTTIRKQGDLVTSNSSDGSEFRIETKHFVNPQMGICDTYNDLRKPPRGNIFPKIIHVLGKNSCGDGGDGIFYWDEINVCADNDYNIIAVLNRSIGRYVKQSKTENIDSIVGVYHTKIDINTPLILNIYTLPCDVILSNIKLIVTIPFNDINASLQFGTKNKELFFLNTNDSILVNSDQYHNDIVFPVKKDDELILNFNRGNATVGECSIFYSLSL